MLKVELLKKVLLPVAAVLFVVVRGAGAQTAVSLSCAERALAVRGPGTLHSFTLSGRIDAVDLSGKTFVEDLHIQGLLPAHYLRSETRHLGGGDVTYLYGFSGGTLLNDVRVSSPSLHFGASWGPEQLGIEQRDAAMLLMGLFAIPTPAVSHVSPLAGGVAMDIGDRHVVLLLDAACKPTGLTYQADVHLPQAGARVVQLPAPQRETVRITFDGRREVDGYLVPRTIVKQAAGILLEKTTIDAFRANPALTPSDFVKGGARGSRRK